MDRLLRRLEGSGSERKGRMLMLKKLIGDTEEEVQRPSPAEPASARTMFPSF